jgi:flagellar protein FlaG
MSIQQLHTAGPRNPHEVSGIAASPDATATDPPKAELYASREDRVDTIPPKPPEDLLDQIARAGARFDELLAQKRELHFAHDDSTNRVVVQVRDLDGNVLRTIPPTNALDVISGAPLDPE